jgi:hypothetical protein
MSPGGRLMALKIPAKISANKFDSSDIIRIILKP